jgi:peroxiredoxin
VQNADAIKAKGIDEIVCVAVNDAMVLASWGRERGLGIRSKRYAMLIEDGKVADLHVEPPGAYGVSSGKAMLERLGA